MSTNINAAKHSAMDYAKYIIDLCTKGEKSISDLRLQKVLYFIQLAYVVNRNEWAFDDEMEAWQYGPVVRTVYNAFKHYGSTKICLNFEDVDVFTQEEKNIIHSMLAKCLEKSVWQLVNMSHVEGGPWDKTYKELGYGRTIPKEYLEEYALK